MKQEVKEHIGDFLAILLLLPLLSLLLWDIPEFFYLVYFIAVSFAAHYFFAESSLKKLVVFEIVIAITFFAYAVAGIILTKIAEFLTYLQSIESNSIIIPTIPELLPFSVNLAYGLVFFTGFLFILIRREDKHVLFLFSGPLFFLISTGLLVLVERVFF